MQQYLYNTPQILTDAMCHTCKKFPIDFSISKAKCTHCFTVSKLAVRRWKDNNKEHCKEMKRKYSKTPKSKEYYKIWQRQYRKSQEYKEYYAKYREENREHLQEKDKNWRKNNPEKFRIKQQVGTERRRARIKLTSSSGLSPLSTKEWKEILSMYGNQCLRCGKPNDIQIDHIVPISRGGTHTKENVQPLCGECNRQKGTKILDFRNIKRATVSI